MNKQVRVVAGNLSPKEEVRWLREENKYLRTEIDRIERILNSTMHDAREFSSIISDRSDHLLKLQRYDEGVVKNINVTSGMLSARFGFTDFEITPHDIDKQVKEDVVVYQKFDKARYLLNHINEYRDTYIEFHGESYMSFQALKAFEMIPFVVLQNAAKYSPRGYSVDVYFEPYDNSLLEVKISSYGPLISDKELERVFDEGFRGRQVTEYHGEGIGLYQARRLCDFHGATIEVHKGDKLGHSLSGREFQRFNVVMRFENFE